jgi:transcriptional regulator with XRE-family HTH domain
MKRPMDRAEWEAFGKWVDELRKRSGLQVRDLAARAGVSVQWLQEIRQGGRTLYGQWRLPNPKDEALARLARALDVPVEEMFARAGRDAAPSDREAETSEASAGRDDADAMRRIRELETRITQYQRELAELRELVEGQQPRRAKSR